LITWKYVRAASVRARIIALDWQTTMMLRLLNLSATSPAGRDKSSTGSADTADITPSIRARFSGWVSSTASQLCATLCIHVPVREMVCPEKNRR